MGDSDGKREAPLLSVTLRQRQHKKYCIPPILHRQNFLATDELHLEDERFFEIFPRQRVAEWIRGLPLTRMVLGSILEQDTSAVRSVYSRT